VALLANRAELADAALGRWLALAPRSEGALAARATLALRRGEVEQAHAALIGLMSPSSGGGWLRALQAMTAAGAGNPVAEVLESLLAAEALPDDLQAWLAFGGLAQRLGRQELARRIVDGILERFADDPRAGLLLAGKRRQDGDADGARAAVARVLELAGDNRGLRQGAAVELEKLGDYRAAAAALAEGPQDETSYATRAAYLSRAGDRVALQGLFEEVKAAGTDRPDPVRRLLLGQMAEYLDKPSEALRWYRSVPAGPARSQARLRVAIVLEEAGDLEGALRQLRQIQVAQDEDGELVRDSYALEAELRVRAREFDAARAAYDRGLAIFEDDPQLLYGRALVHERLDEIVAAEADLRAVLALDPGNAAALNALGYTLADRTERYAEALEYIERAYAQEPDNAAIVDSLGWVLYRLGRREEALTHLRRAFELVQDAEIAAHLGELLWVLGEKDAARAVWDQGKAIDPESRALRQALEKFNP
jgi:tetratricopeptide (TPR) repeat protein